MDQISSESVVLIVCTAAIGTLFTACSAGLGWLLNRGVKQIDVLSKSHGDLNVKHAVLETKVDGHEAWLQDHELVINEFRGRASQQ